MKRNSMLAAALIATSGSPAAAIAAVQTEEPKKPNPANSPAPFSKPYKRARWDKKPKSESLERLLRKAKK